MSTSRRKFSLEFKSKVVLESLKEYESIESLAKKYEIHPSQISQWRSQALKNFNSVFGSESKKEDSSKDKEVLYAQIGQLKVENDFLKKKLK